MGYLELKKFYQGKKVFVTGGTGFKGSWLITLLNELGSDVCVYALAPNTQPNMFDIIGGKKFVKYIEADIRDCEKLTKSMVDFQPEIVLHLAAQPIVITSYEKPHYTYETNVMGTVNLFEAVRKTKSVKSVVNVTTDKVYLNNDEGKAFKETDPLCGYDPYSNSKSCSELVTYSYLNSFFNVNDFEKHHVSISTCRAGNVIGGGDWADYRLVPDCVKSILKNEAVVIRNPYSTRPFQHVLEPLFMYLKLAMLQYENPSYIGNYNIGPDIKNCVSVLDIMQTFKKYMPQASCVVNQQTNAKPEPSKLTLDIEKSKKVLGFMPIYDVDKTIETIADWTNAYINKENMYNKTKQQIEEFFKNVSIKEF